MNIALNLNTLDHILSIFDHGIKFLDTKCNNIMEGVFTKIIYSDEFVSLNGLYLVCSLHISTNGRYSSNFWKNGEDLDKMGRNTSNNNNNNNEPRYTILQRPKSIGNLAIGNLETVEVDKYANNWRPSSQNNDLIGSNTDEFISSRSWINSLDKYKNILSFQPNHSLNIPVIHQFVQFEKQLLDYYKQYTFSKKKTVYLLQNQLLSGSTKVYRDLNENTLNNNSTTNVHYIIKISGVWESADTIGITYKFLEMY